MIDLSFIKRNIREWLFDDEPDDLFIEARHQSQIGDEIVEYEAISAAGHHLKVRRLDDPLSERLISVRHAVSPKRFRQLHQHLTKGLQPTWEDGKPAEFPQI